MPGIARGEARWPTVVYKGLEECRCPPQSERNCASRSRLISRPACEYQLLPPHTLARLSSAVVWRAARYNDVATGETSCGSETDTCHRQW